MDRYWRVGSPFTAIKYVSRGLPDLFVVGVVIHSGHEGADEKLDEVWNKMKNLIPEDYYLDYDMLKIELSGYPSYIVFDTYEQGEAFVKFVEEHFNEDSLGYAALYVDGECHSEST